MVPRRRLSAFLRNASSTLLSRVLHRDREVLAFPALHLGPEEREADRGRLEAQALNVVKAFPSRSRSLASPTRTTFHP